MDTNTGNGNIYCPFDLRANTSEGHNYPNDYIIESKEYIYSEEFLNFATILVGEIIECAYSPQGIVISQAEFDFKVFKTISNFVDNILVQQNPILSDAPEMLRDLTLYDFQQHVRGHKRIFFDNIKIPKYLAAILGEGGLFDVLSVHWLDALQKLIEIKVDIDNLHKEIITILPNSNFRNQGNLSTVTCPAKALVRSMVVYSYLKYHSRVMGRNFYYDLGHSIQIRKLTEAYKSYIVEA